MMIQKKGFVVSVLLLCAAAIGNEAGTHHFDISPYMVDGELLTGGLDHSGNPLPPTIHVFGFDFGEDPWDPYNPSDPGVFQLPAYGDLPSGASFSYNILTSLLFWDGTSEAPEWESSELPYITLLVGTQTRTIDGDSGPQAGSYIQAVLSDGSLHKHFTSSLYAEPGAENIPGIPGYVVPPVGIFAFQMELTMSTGHVSNSFWVVYNHGCDVSVHDLAMESLQPQVGNPDSDEDGDVDLADFAAFQVCTGSTDQECLDAFDFNTDGAVDADDYEAFEQEITGPQV